VGARPHVAQADEQRQGIHHSGEFWGKNRTGFTKVVLVGVGAWRQPLTLP
jgi:hypothetical protein